MEKLADISHFETLMNGKSVSRNTVFNKTYPETPDPFKEGFHRGFNRFPWVLSRNPLIPLVSLMIKSGCGTVSGLLKKIEHSKTLKQQIKEIESMVQDIIESGKKPEALTSVEELQNDFDAKKMNRDQYLQLLKDLFYDNSIYRSSDYDDPLYQGDKPEKYEGPTLYDYMGGEGVVIDKIADIEKKVDELGMVPALP